MAHYDFKNTIYHADEDCEEDCEIPEELARLLKQESKFIQPYQDSLEVINLGSKECKKRNKDRCCLEREC